MQIQVIGGGIAGASIAYHFAKNGIDVKVYDRHDAGQATEVSAGIICPWVSQRRNKAWYTLVREGAKYYPSFIQELEQYSGLETGYKKTGALLLFPNEKVHKLSFERITSKFQDAPEMGELTMLTKEMQRTYFPALTTEHYAHHLTGAALVNGKTLVLALKEAFLRLGGEWKCEDAPGTSEETIVIHCAGAWGNERQRTIPVSHQKAQLLHFEMDSDQQFPVVMGLKTHYIISFGNGKFAIGTTHEDTESFDVSPTEAAKEELLALATHYFPEQRLKNVHMAVGLRPYTPNHLPVVQKVDSTTWVVNGLGSSGLTAAPVLGRELVKLIVSGESQIDLTPYQVKGEE